MDQEQTDEDCLDPRRSGDMDNNALAARKVLKADRERLRRDKLNEQLLELGNLLDHDRPKNDKASVIADAIQELNDLNSEVKKLKVEQAVLNGESRELTQEKNELREEKASLRADIQDLKAQHQQTQRFMVHPWATVDSPMLMASPYSFPIALPGPPGPGPVPLHPTLQALPFPANHHGPSSTFIPYLSPVVPQFDRSATLNASTSCISGPRSSSPRPFDERRSSRGKIGISNDVTTDLELKVPGSTGPKELSRGEKGEEAERRHEKSETSGSCSGKSSQVYQGGSSNSVDDL